MRQNNSKWSQSRCCNQGTFQISTWKCNFKHLKKKKLFWFMLTYQLFNDSGLDVCIFSVCLCFLRYSCFLPHSKDMQIGVMLIGDFKMTISVNVSLNGRVMTKRLKILLVPTWNAASVKTMLLPCMTDREAASLIGYFSDKQMDRGENWPR